MGRKVHPIGFRLNINQPWQGRWFAEGDNIVNSSPGFRHPRHDLPRKLAVQASPALKWSVSRQSESVVYTAKPGILIGRKGEGVKKIRASSGSADRKED